MLNIQQGRNDEDALKISLTLPKFQYDPVLSFPSNYWKAHSQSKGEALSLDNNGVLPTVVCYRKHKNRQRLTLHWLQQCKLAPQIPADIANLERNGTQGHWGWKGFVLHSSCHFQMMLTRCLTRCHDNDGIGLVGIPKVSRLWPGGKNVKIQDFHWNVMGVGMRKSWLSPLCFQKADQQRSRSMYGVFAKDDMTFTRVSLSLKGRPPMQTRPPEFFNSGCHEAKFLSSLPQYIGTTFYVHWNKVVGSSWIWCA